MHKCCCVVVVVVQCASVVVLLFHVLHNLYFVVHSSSSRLEEAAELFQKAGNIYKANKQSTGERVCSCVFLSTCFVSRCVRLVHS